MSLFICARSFLIWLFLSRWLLLYNAVTVPTPIGPEAFTTSFWMGAFQGPTAKRHRLWSNSSKLLGGIWQVGGYMSKEAMRALPGGPSVRKYTDRNGVARTVGLKDKLKASQLLEQISSGVVVQTCFFLVTRHYTSDEMPMKIVIL